MNRSSWTHAICGPCWDETNPDTTPYTVEGSTEEKCCCCNAPTRAGIFIRNDPTELNCKGEHKKESR